MKTKIIQNIKSIILALILVLGVSYVSAFSTWVAPTATAPGNNADTPLNVSGTGQIKIGGLTLNCGTNAGCVFNSTSASYGLIVPNGYVGIGTTSPSAKLQVADGTVLFNSGTANHTRIHATGDGYAGAGPLVLSGDPVAGTGWAFVKGIADYNGTPATRFEINGNGGGYFLGDVGIGTTPGYKLDILGSMRLQATTAPTGANGVMYYDSGTNKFRCYQNSAWVDCITSGSGLPAGTEGQMLYNNAGVWTAHSGTYWDDTNNRLGIGTISPKAKLSIGESDDLLNIYRYSDNVLGIQTTLDNQPLGTYGGGNNVLSLQPLVGNVGIGTTSPVSKLHVYGTGAAPSLSSTAEIMDIHASPSQALAIGGDSGGQYSMWLQTKRTTNDGSSWPLALNPVGGNVGIGTTDPQGYKLRVAGSTKLDSWLDVGGNINANSGTVSAINLHATTGGIDGPWISSTGGMQAEGDLVLSGSNKWIIHTPNDGRTSIWITPYTGTDWNWAAQTEFKNNGDIAMSGKIQIKGGSPGVGKVLTSDDNGLASWQSLPSSGKPYCTAKVDSYYVSACGNSYTGKCTGNIDLRDTSNRNICEDNDGCVIYVHGYSASSTDQHYVVERYLQYLNSTSHYWVSTLMHEFIAGQQVGINGDGVQRTIINLNGGNFYLYDDWGSDNYDFWAWHDNNDSRAYKIWICDY